MVPPDLPKGVAPMDCRATQAFLHRVSPGQYHFQRAQYLLGAGPDFIGCEAFGLDRYQKGVEQDEKGVDEALAALRNPIGLEQWRPEAPRYVLARGYRALSKDYEVLAEKQGSAEYHRNAERLLETAKKVEESKALAPASSVETRASSCVAVSWFADAVKGDAVAVRKCLSTGTPADSRGLGGMTALMYAALSGKEEIARILLEAKADPNAQDNEGSSAFRDAIVTNYLGIVERLLAKGAQVDAPDDEGTTALMDSAAMGFSDTVEHLLAAGASVNVRAQDGSSALLDAAAAMSGHGAQRSRILIMLISKGADVNVADWDGITPLLAAAVQNDTTTLEALVRAGAHLDAANRDGETALELGAKEDRVQTVDFLLSHNANPNLATQQGETPLMLAAKGLRKNNHSPVVATATLPTAANFASFPSQ